MKSDTATGQAQMGFPFTSDESYLKVGADLGMWDLPAEGSLESDAPGTTARFNAGKTKWELLPMHLLEGTADVLEYGAKKYAAWNWAKGAKWSTSFSSCLRHLFRWYFLGEDLDKESGLHHLDHALCNLLFSRHYTLKYGEGDDRPSKHFGA